MTRRGSICVVGTVCNAVEFIDRYVDSVPVALRSRVRHVVADGGSVDGTSERLREHAAGMPHLVVLDSIEQTMVQGLNRAVDAAPSTHVVVLNADDSFEPGGLEALVDVVETSHPPGLVIGGLRVLDEHGATFRIQRTRRMRPGDILLDRDYPWNPACMAYARSIHEVAGRYDEREALFDLAFLLRIARTIRPVLIDRVVGCFNMQPDSLTVRRLRAGELDGMIADLFSRFEETLPWPTRVHLSVRRGIRSLRHRMRRRL